MKTTINMPDEVAKNIYDTYLSENVDKGTAFNAVCEGFMQLRTITLYSLRGLFLDKELMLVVDILNGVGMDVKLKGIPDVLIANIEDSDKYDSAGAKWKVDINDLCKKVKQLTPAQVFFLQDEISRWWEKQWCSSKDFVKTYSK